MRAGLSPLFICHALYFSASALAIDLHLGDLIRRSCPFNLSSIAHLPPSYPTGILIIYNIKNHWSSVGRSDLTARASSTYKLQRSFNGGWRSVLREFHRLVFVRSTMGRTFFPKFWPLKQPPSHSKQSMARGSTCKTNWWWILGHEWSSHLMQG